MSELVGHLRAALAAGAGAGAEPVSRLGYFCAPFRPADGPLSDKVIKVYRGGRDPEVLELLARRHDAYLDCVRQAGLRMPETRFLILNEHGFLRPVVVQDAMPAGAMMTDLFPRADQAIALAMLDRVAEEVTGFWRGVAQRPERIGLHASIRDFAFDDDGPLFIDSFPPLISYSREEMGRLMLRFSESGLIRGIGALLPGRVREIQDAWYTLNGSLATLIQGALRMRPGDRAAILDWAQGFGAAHLSPDEREALRERLARSRPLPSLEPPKRRVVFGERPHA